MKKSFLLSLLLYLTSCTPQPPEESRVAGPYLGRPEPGNRLELFAPGILSDGLHNRDIAITPDGREIYTTVGWGRDSFSKILVCRMEEGAWSDPEPVPFSSGFGYQDIEPVISPDGKRMLFVSNRPDPANGRLEKNWDIWSVHRQGDEWGEPVNLGPPVNSDSDEYFPGITDSGNVYFTRLDETTRENLIFRCRWEDGEFLEAEKLDENVNCGRARFNATIAPDEGFIIIPCAGMPDSLGGVDYYISFRDSEDQWSSPINMGPEINSATGNEWSASLSPDGRFLFLMKSIQSDEFFELPVTMENIRRIAGSPGNGDSDVYWISSSIIDRLERQLQQSLATE